MGEEVAEAAEGEAAVGLGDSASWPCRFVGAWARTTAKPWASCKATREEFLSGGKGSEAVRQRLQNLVKYPSECCQSVADLPELWFWGW